MSQVQRTYRVWNGCGWTRVTTSEAVWRATPRYLGVVAGCTGGAVGIIGGGIALAWPHDAGARWPTVNGAPLLHGHERGRMPASYQATPGGGSGAHGTSGGVPCPEPSALALFGLAAILIIAIRIGFGKWKNTNIA